MAEKIKKDLKDVEDNKVIAAASYVWIIALYGLLFKRDSAFVQFHAKQGTALFIAEVLSPLFGPLAIIIWVLAIVLAIKGVKASLEGKYWVMPLVGDWIRQKKI